MEMFDRLYDESENAKVRFMGFTSDTVRYDFGIIYTHMFFGKPLIVCMQTGRSALLDAGDMRNFDYIKKAFHLQTIEEAEELSAFFEEVLLPSHFGAEQYD